MINEEKAGRYCREDIALIENYAQAVQDSKIWDCHHRAETDEKLSYKELKAQGRYWKRPASELIFLTKSEHLKRHYDAGTRENQREAARKVCAANSRKGALKRSKKVLQFTLSGEFVREWQSLMEINRELGFNVGHICDCCNGKRQSGYKYLWRYADAV